MQICGSASKSPINNKRSGKKIDMIICLQMGKTYMVKTPLSDFKVTTPKNSLLSQQVVTS